MKKLFAVLAIFALVLGFSSCDTGESTENIDKKGTIYVYAGAASSLEIAHNSKGFTFPDTYIGESAEVTIVVKNTGSGGIKLTGIPYVNLDGATAVFSVSSAVETSTISPDSSASFKIKFSPVNAVESYVYVSIPNNSKNAPDFSFTVYGTGVRPKPTASVFYGDNEITQNGTINAGIVVITQSKNIAVVIKNTGEEILTLDTANITITGTDAEAFTKITNPASSISVGEQTSFIISCEPVKQGENDATLIIPTNDNSRNPVVVYLRMTAERGTAVLQLRQDSTIIANNSLTPFDFKRVALESNKPLVFTIKNTGNIALELTGNPIVVSSNALFEVQTQPANKIISPGDEALFLLTYMPTTEKEDYATITIINDSDSMVFILHVKGNGYIKRPQITVKQGTTAISPNGVYGFGTIVYSATKSDTFTIQNSGEAVLTFTMVDGNRISLEENTGGHFSVSQQPLVMTITPGNSATFTLRFNPTALGSFNAIVKIITDSQYNDEFSFRVTGSGRNYAVGDTGPGGGIIFYVAGNEYKECSEDLGQYSCNDAVTVATNHIGGGFTDWRLPDRGELNLINQNIKLKGLGGFISNYRYFLWSSQVSGNYVYYMEFFFSSTSEYYSRTESKTVMYSVRAVRSFGL